MAHPITRQRELVERERWMTPAQFLELLSLGQVLPGPNIVNMALILGDRFFGWRGALAALFVLFSVLGLRGFRRRAFG